jgi:exodeoxyribonuclease V alpha subunit
MDSLDGVPVFVRVSAVRVQNRYGAVFFGQRVSEDGQICQVDEDLTVSLQQHAVGVRLCEGQRWRVLGEVRQRNFVTATGFRRIERTISVRRGDALLVKPSGAHIRDYMSRHPDLVGIGTVTANNLWDRFGERLYAVLDEEDYQALADVIAPAKAARLVEVWREEGLSHTIQFLAAHDVSPVVGRRLVSVHGAKTMDRIQEDPYRLLSYCAAWRDVDALAASMGVQADDTRRLAAACEEVVYREFSDGHTYVPRHVLEARLIHLLRDDRKPMTPTSMALVLTALERAEIEGRLHFDQAGNGYSIGACLLEEQVAEAVARAMSPSQPSVDVSRIIREYEEREGHGFALNAKQRDAIDLVAKHRFAVISGGAGCGKTTVLKAVCDVLEAQDYEIVQLALAGKAVMRMTQATGRKAKTIASYIKDLTGEGESRTHWGNDGKQAIVIDEASMVDLISFAAIARSLDENKKVVMVGDPHQLPPVGPGLVFHALIDGAVPHVHLDIPERFGSEIAAVANGIRLGVLPDLESNQSVSLIEPPVLGAYAEWAKGVYLEDFDDAVVLCHSRELSGEINGLIQDRLTGGNMPMTIWNHQYDTRQDLGFREGDRIICTRNFWDKGLQNGSMGRIMRIETLDQDEVRGEISWDDGEERVFDEDLVSHLELAYALTVHKAQGSQWARVVVCLKGSPRIDRSLIYTAVTRASRQVIIIGNRHDLEVAIKAPKAADRRRVALSKWLAAVRLGDLGDGRLVRRPAAVV